MFRKLCNSFDEKIKEEKDKVVEAGGLKIIGTERHESRRIDNQLRGRSGRQGDIGESRFYIGLDDDLMKLFGGQMVSKVYDTLNADENIPIELGMVSKAVENAQKKVEGRNFSIRKHVLSYDDVMNKQREIIYKQRRQVLDGENMSETIKSMIRAVAEQVVDSYVGNEEFSAKLNKDALINELNNIFEVKELDSLNKKMIDKDQIVKEIVSKAEDNYKAKEEEIGSENMLELERIVMLKVVDQKWMDHIDAMDDLKNGIGLRAYGQKDPVVQYRIEGFDMFDEMIIAIKLEVVKLMMHIRKNPNAQRVHTATITGQGKEEFEGVPQSNVKPVTNTDSEAKHTPVVNDGPKVNRNEPCPCGSGKKYKNCCGNK